MSHDPEVDPAVPADDDSRGSSSRSSTAGNGVMAIVAIAALCYAGYSIMAQIRDRQHGRQIVRGDGSAGLDGVPRSKKGTDSEGGVARRRGNVIQRDGKTLLWAGNDPQSGGDMWFDITDGLLDSHGFQYGLGKDTTPAVDKGLFLAADDPRLLDYEIDDDSSVLGYAHDGPEKREEKGTSLIVDKSTWSVGRRKGVRMIYAAKRSILTGVTPL